jgi:iron complex transport system ATP-binding protein
MLTVRGLHAGYGADAVLRGIDLDVARGELCALVGPNGCGKTTLIRVISGILPPQSGTVLLDGVDRRRAGAAATARHIAVVAQGAALPERFTAFEVALMGRTPHLRLMQSESRHDVDVVRAAMERADCWQLRARYVEELSGGERQRVIIARALAQEPELLLLDEPTSHLDIQHQVEAFQLVLELCREQGLAALAVVHDLTLAAMFADRIAMLSRGTITAAGAPEDVLQPHIIEQVYGTAVRVLAHPTTGRPIVVPDMDPMARITRVAAQMEASRAGNN